MSTAIRTFLLLVIFAEIAEMCGNVSPAVTPAPATGGSTINGQNKRKRRSVEGSSIVHIEFETTLTSAGDLEFSKIENELDEEFEDLLAKAHRQTATGTEGGSVLKYMFIEVDCGTAQLFARSVKDLTSFVTGGTIKCNDQTSNI